MVKVASMLWRLAEFDGLGDSVNLEKKVCLWHKKGKTDCMCDVCKEWHQSNNCSYGQVINKKIDKVCICE